jgi:hypothetical protein
LIGKKNIDKPATMSPVFFVLARSKQGAQMPSHWVDKSPEIYNSKVAANITLLASFFPYLLYNLKAMKRALFVIAALLLAGWVLGFFILNAGVFIHIFIIVSAIACMQAVILTPRTRLEKANPA